MTRAAALLALLGASLAAAPVGRELPTSALRVRVGASWVTWWRSDRAPDRWDDGGPLAARLRPRATAPGVAWGELLLAGSGEAWRTRLVVAVIDPRRVRLGLDTSYVEGRPAWRAEAVAASCSGDVAFAVNAGQFVQTLPWGWVVLNGERYLTPGSGPLVTSVIVDSLGAVHWRHGEGPARPAPGGVAHAFQSYPTLLRDGEVPAPLRAAGRGVDVAHRDARLAIGRLADGRIVVGMTRFEGLGGVLQRLPFGLTAPEMAAVMGALGARDAVMLDGGISAQMLVRRPDGRAMVWSGMRAVPLALTATTRRQQPPERCRPE